MTRLSTVVVLPYFATSEEWFSTRRLLELRIERVQSTSVLQCAVFPFERDSD